ncbi:conserved hypothetical protein [Candidatus Terasakiella magnetica]|uniref:Uncharacterized protein n=1 Tax=Candidatus Terasakiella magnetica TaxID=1867952 RepID=A0A1C3RF90_9PROT|nr:relaxase/mobilization nuclease domain-containing protein [Candidatus Terasakiella magnetica]SCA55950.1 conserved hypothetical protein [Candidatus Terasakiella magnetica]
MIIKGSSRGQTKADVIQLSNHLLSSENEEVNVLQLKGLASLDLSSALEEMRAISLGTKTRKALYHASISVPVEELHLMNQERWLEAVNTLERHLDFEGHQRTIIQHNKKGRIHIHIVWNRVDTVTLKSKKTSWSYKKHEACSRELEAKWNLQQVQGVHMRNENEERPVAVATHKDWQASSRTGVPIKAVCMTLQTAWEQANASQFVRIVEDAGYRLAKGKRGVVLVDMEGTPHSIPRRLKVKAKAFKDRFPDLQFMRFPSVGAIQAKLKFTAQEQFCSEQTQEEIIMSTKNFVGIRPKNDNKKKKTGFDWNLLAEHWRQLGFDPQVGNSGIWIDVGDANIHDTGDEITLHGPVTKENVQAMLDAARLHDWKGVEPFGSEDFKAMVYQLASKMEPPMPVVGYELPPHIKKALGIPDEANNPDIPNETTHEWRPN